MDKSIKSWIIFISFLISLIYFSVVWGINTFEDYINIINSSFEHLVGFLYPILFFDISFNYFGTSLPLIVIVLLFGALLFTFYFGFSL